MVWPGLPGQLLVRPTGITYADLLAPISQGVGSWVLDVATITDIGGEVDAIDDLSAEANDMTAPLAANRPPYAADAGYNGRLVMSFDGIAQYLRAVGVPIADADRVSLWMAGATDDAVTAANQWINQGFHGGPDGESWQWLLHDAADQWRFFFRKQGGALINSGDKADDQNKHLFEQLAEAGVNTKLFVDTVELWDLLTQAGIDSDGTMDIYLGANSTPAGYCNCTYGASGIDRVPPSAANIAAIRANFSEYYALGL